MKDITEIISFGPQEPEMSKLTKQLYVLVQHDNPLKKINYAEFLRNIKEHCKTHHFDWTCRNDKTNRRVYPSVKGNAIHWCKNYDYPGAYRTFAEYQNGENTTDLLLLEKTLQDGTIRQLFQMAQDCLDRIDELSEQEKINPTFNAAYLKKAETERYVMIMEEIRKRLGIDEETLNINSTNTTTNVNLSYEEMIAQEESFFKALYEDKP